MRRRRIGDPPARVLRIKQSTGLFYLLSCAFRKRDSLHLRKSCPKGAAFGIRRLLKRRAKTYMLSDFRAWCRSCSFAAAKRIGIRELPPENVRDMPQSGNNKLSDFRVCVLCGFWAARSVYRYASGRSKIAERVQSDSQNPSDFRVWCRSCGFAAAKRIGIRELPPENV